MNITNAQYVFDYGSTTEIGHIKADINGTTSFIPVDEDNYMYKEIMQQVDAGTLTIQDAD